LVVSRQRNQRSGLVKTFAKPGKGICRVRISFALMARLILLLCFGVISPHAWGAESGSAPVGATRFLEPPMDLSPMGPGTPSTQGTSPSETSPPVTPAAPPTTPAQPGTGTSAPASGTTPPPAVQEVKPEQIYIRDVDGSLKLMLGWTMAQFEELVRLRDGLEQRNQAPPYVVEEAHVQGKCVDEYAELVVRVRVRLRTDQPCKIPLRLEQLVLRELPQRPGGQPMLFSYNRQDGGYVLYLQGSADTAEEIVFRGWVPITHVGSEARLVLSVPDAPLSDLELDFPPGEIEPIVTPGATVLGMEAVEGGQRLKVTGLGPGFVLSWNVSPTTAAEQETVLESNGIIAARITEGVVDFDARLTVRSYGVPFDRFRVVLPPGARGLPFSSSSYSVQEVNPDPQNRATVPGQTMVEVVLTKKTTGPVDVRITAQLQRTADAWTELGGFSVDGAVRQTGYLTVVPASDQGLIWGELRGVRQVSHVPASGNGEPSEDAVHFEYFTQPCTVQMKAVRRAAHVTIVPRYRVELSSGKAQLQARLSYDVRGADVTTLDIQLAGWQLQEALLGEQSTALAVTGDPLGLASLALPQAMSGRFEVTILASRDEPLEKPPLAMSFPQPKGQVIQPAEVVIVAPANLELRTDYKKSQGVEPATGQPGEAGASAVNVVTFRLEKPDARFVADWTLRKQEVSLDMVTRATQEGSQLSVEQRVRYQVRYEAWTEPWRFRIPAGIDQVSVLLDGRPVQLTRVVSETPSPQGGSAGSTGQSSGSGLQVSDSIFAILPIGPVLGSSEVVFRYTVTGGTWSTESSRWPIPLVDPLDGQLQQHRLSVILPAGLEMDSVEAPWRLVERKSLQGVSLSQMECETTARASQVVLRPHAGMMKETNMIVVEKMLIQTRLDRVMRQDRCALRFFTKQTSLNLELPRGARSDLVQIWLDGRPIQPRPTSRTNVVVPLGTTAMGSASGEMGSEHLLELWYELPRFRHSWGRTNLECLRLDSHAIVQRVYWEIVLLPDEHVAWNGSEVTAEYRWGWTGFFWGRLPVVAEEDLERWAGVSEGWLHVSGQANRYLFGALRAVDSVNIWCLRRQWIVGLCSAAIVFVGLGLVYLGPFARKLLVLGTVVVVTAMLLLRPDVALLAGQAAALGLALTILSLVLYRAISASDTATLRGSAWSERTSLETVICQRTSEAVANCADRAAAVETPTEVHR